LATGCLRSRRAGPPCSRPTSFLADAEGERPRVLSEQGTPAHRLRVEHNRQTLLVHLSDEVGEGWVVPAVDGPTPAPGWTQSGRRLDAAEDAYARLHPDA
jgi:hypothetical protein